MKTIIDVGTSKGNYRNISFDKPFENITNQDIEDFLLLKKVDLDNVFIYGWIDVTHNKYINL